MKFGKSLMRVVETSDPEWGPYWMNYKLLKRKINEIDHVKAGVKVIDLELAKNADVIAKSTGEVEFFNLLKSELKKSSDFFTSTEAVLRVRKERIWGAFDMLKNEAIVQDQNAWTRLLIACVNFYKDVLLIENFAIMTYCGFSKILKKHDKVTGFVTREAFMRKVMNRQNIAQYPYVMELIKEAEVLYENIQQMESVMPLKDEERLFIEVLREVNHQASVLQAVEKGMTGVAAAAAEAAVGVAAAAGATAGAVYLSVSAGTPESDKENSEESKHGAEGTQSSSHADVPATYPSKANALSAAQEEIADTADIAEDATGDGCGDGDVENREAAHRLAAHNLDIATASVLEAAQRYQSSTRAANDGDHVAAIKAAAKNGASAGAGVGAVSGSKRSASQADLDKSNKSNKSDKSESN